MRCPSLTIGIALVLASATAWGAESALTKKQLQVLSEGVVPAYKQGDASALLKLLSPLAAELTEPRLAAADELLATQEVPAVADLLGQSRLALVIQGAGPQLPLPKPREAALTAQGIKAVLERTLAEKARHRAFAEQLPKPATLEEYRQLFWSIHVLENQLRTAYDVARYADGLARSVPERQQTVLSDQQRETLATNWGELASQISAAQRELEEREAELRLQRLEIAAARLGEQGFTKERLLAAAALEEDGRLLLELLAQGDPAKGGRSFSRKALRAPSLAETVKEQVVRGRKLGGDVVTKGQLLFAGMHWWLRPLWAGAGGLGSAEIGLGRQVATDLFLAVHAARNAAADRSLPLGPPVARLRAPTPLHLELRAALGRQRQYGPENADRRARLSAVYAQVRLFLLRAEQGVWNGQFHQHKHHDHQRSLHQAA